MKVKKKLLRLLLLLSKVLLVHCVCISLAWRKLFCFLHYFDFEVVLWMLQQEDFLPVVVLVRLERQNSHCSRDSGCPFWQRSFSFFRSACLYGPIIWSSRKDLNWKRNRQTNSMKILFESSYFCPWVTSEVAKAKYLNFKFHIFALSGLRWPQVASGGLGGEIFEIFDFGPQVASEATKAKYLNFLIFGLKWIWIFPP